MYPYYIGTKTQVRESFLKFEMEPNTALGEYKPMGNFKISTRGRRSAKNDGKNDKNIEVSPASFVH
jgi:hypothetical protein